MFPLPLYPLRAARRSPLFLLVINVRHVDTTQKVVPLGASLLRTADVSQADLSPRLQEEEEEEELNK